MIAVETITISPSASEVFLVVALVLFLCAAAVAIQSKFPRVNLVALGLAFVALALLVA